MPSAQCPVPSHHYPRRVDLSSKRVVVMGLGRFGGGVGVSRWLAARGADLLITDTAPAETLTDSLAAINDLVRAGRITLRLGEHNVSDFTTADLIVANPAVPKPWDNRFLRAAEAARIATTTEIALTIRRAREVAGPGRFIAITGSVGKSTTTAMIAHALAAVGEPVLMGGNIGGSLLADLDTLAASHAHAHPPPLPAEGVVATGDRGRSALTAHRPPPPWVVLELSSAMLHWLDREPGLNFAPHIAVAANLAANHMDWHGTLDHYTTSKQHLLRHQSATAHAILGASIAHWPPLGAAPRTIITSDASLSRRPLLIPGQHNRLNAAMALAACEAALGPARRADLLAALNSFRGLAHRLELVAERDGIRYYNDSKCTTPEAMLKALDALESAGIPRARIHLLAGGYNKNIDLAPVADAARTLAGLHCLGDTGPAIAALARARHIANTTLSRTLAQAVAAARPLLKPGDCLLLSPASASWDQYPNYEHRGDEFKHLVSS